MIPDVVIVVRGHRGSLARMRRYLRPDELAAILAPTELDVDRAADEMARAVAERRRRT